jgi:hypothetical protein
MFLQRFLKALIFSTILITSVGFSKLNAPSENSVDRFSEICHPDPAGLCPGSGGPGTDPPKGTNPTSA